MNEKLKNPNVLFDAEALASHISILTSQSEAKTGGKSAGGKSGSLNKGSSKNMGSKVKDSKNESESQSNMSESSTQKLQSTDTVTATGAGGDFANVKAKDIHYVDEELPESMMKAIRIINRLLTQSKYHHE